MILIKSICKAIKDYSVLQRSLSHFDPRSHVNDMRSLQENASEGVRWFVSPVHNTARQQKRQTSALCLQAATPNPGSLPRLQLCLSLQSLPAGTDCLASAFPQLQITKQQVFSLHKSNQLSLGPYSHGSPILPVCSRGSVFCCQPTSSSLSAQAASEP